MTDVSYVWRGDFTNAEVNALHAEGFGHPMLEDDWKRRSGTASGGSARDSRSTKLRRPFVDVPWDGGTHAFILDTLVDARAQRQGIGTRLVALAAEQARAAGCEWLHADFGDELAAFYFEACGFVPTPAGLIALWPARWSETKA